jgi:hypothetical protein
MESIKKVLTELGGGTLPCSPGCPWGWLFPHRGDNNAGSLIRPHIHFYHDQADRLRRCAVAVLRFLDSEAI